MQLDQIVAATAQLLETIDGLRVFDHVPPNTFGSAAVITPRTPFRYADTFDSGRFEFTIWIRVSSASAEEAQTTLLQYISADGANSIPYLIETNATLNNQVASASLVECADYSAHVETDGTRPWTAELVLEVLA